ncbi:unannotated protein [freshwater metagenome]|uniref:Unannotated protein n=1 Tax=freshwater metagenome TaxID=449393 RepID=A0A6J6UP82_9ZZZZ|nr:DUF4307 domain-containing protein [Actinomycetota bacterium]
MTEPYKGDPYLENRYGLSHSRFPKWLVTALVFAIIGSGWLAWSANHYSNPEIRSTLISFREIDSKSIEIRYSLEIANPGIAIICRLSARDYGLNVVGQIDDQIPLGRSKLTRVVQIPTRLAAVNAQIESCTSA